MTNFIRYPDILTIYDDELLKVWLKEFSELNPDGTLEEAKKFFRIKRITHKFPTPKQ